MKKKLVLLAANLGLIVCINAQTASDLSVLDTRNSNEGPNTYSQRVRFDFKWGGMIGIPSPSWGTTMTIAQWIPDGSGGKNHQLHFNDGGIFYRTGTSSNSSWDSWRSVVLTDVNGNLGLGSSNPPTDKLQIGDFNNTNDYKLNIPGVYNFEQVRLGQYGNGACGLEFINHTGMNTSYGVRFRSNIDEGIIGLQIQTANSASSLSEINYVTRLAITNTGYISIGGAPIDNRRLMIYGSDNTASGIALDVKNLGGEDILSCNNDASVNIGYSNALNVLRTGNVLIGQTTQKNPNYKLDVAGSIRANEIKVNMDGADFVFEPTYKLRSLAEVKTFINQHKHLPDVASAIEMQTNGVSMGEMQAKLLQKVEELTLYSIEQEKQLQEQRQSNADVRQQLAEQAKQNNELKQEVEQLKQLITQKLK